MRADGQQTVLLRIEMGLVLEERRLGERTLHRVTPAVELARQDRDLAGLLHRIGLTLLLGADDGETAVAANVVESINVAVAVLDQEEVIPGYLEPDVFPRLSESLWE